MNYEIRPEEKGFTLIYRGVEVGTAKLHCDAVLIGKQLDKQFELEYHRGCKTLERFLEEKKADEEFQMHRRKMQAEHIRRVMEKL